LLVLGARQSGQHPRVVRQDRPRYAQRSALVALQMHAPGIYTDAEIEGKAYLYADGDYNGKVYDTREVAGSQDNYVFGGFRAKNREFIDSLKRGKEVTSSPFRDTVKTMEVCETILAQALHAKA
jgi:hypothetical protein